MGRFEWLLSPPESTGIALAALGAFFLGTFVKVFFVDFEGFFGSADVLIPRLNIHSHGRKHKPILIEGEEAHTVREPNPETLK